MSGRLIVFATIAVLSFATLAARAAAAPLIAFTDNDPGGGAELNLAAHADVAAVEWTQTVAAHDMTVSATLMTVETPSSGDWWITRAIGPSTSAADIVASGKYAPRVQTGSLSDFNALPQVELAAGLDLGPGSYFLVLGPPAVGVANWVGDVDFLAPATLAPGFTLGDYLVGTSSPDPSASFIPLGGLRFNFTLTGSGVPEPAAWALLLAGFALVGARLRRRRGRGFGLAAAAMLALGAAPASAAIAPLIELIDDNPGAANFTELASGPDLNTVAAGSWTQTVSATNVTVSARLTTFGAPTEGDWWITRAIGPSSTPADLVAAGEYTPVHIDAADEMDDFNDLFPTIIATGLDFGPGTYFLVLGPPSGSPALWAGDSDVSEALAPGFTIGGYAFAHGAGPSATFAPNDVAFFSFGLTSFGVPEPSGWALAITGFGLAGAALRRPREGAPA